MPGIRNTYMKAIKCHINKAKQKLWKNPELINDLFTDDEWQAHQATELSKEKSEQMYAQILENVSNGPEQEAEKYSLKAKLFTIGRYAAAAVVFVALGFALWTYQWRPQPENAGQPNQTAAVHQPKTAPAVIWEVVGNTSTKTKQVHLPDQSVVTLYPHGTLKYEQGFSKRLRDIYLTGKAYFKVKRNPERPFSVFAGGLKTTALGTSFTINTMAGHQQTSVKLHTGKIVVSPESKTSKQAALYLNKAESALLYDRLNQVASLTKPVPVVKQALPMSLNRNGRVLTMQNIPLAEVITLLHESYQVKINANPAEINNITYTGVVNPDKESIESVLNVIALINNMTLSRGADQEYILQKSIK